MTIQTRVNWRLVAERSDKLRRDVRIGAGWVSVGMVPVWVAVIKAVTGQWDKSNVAMAALAVIGAFVSFHGFTLAYLAYRQVRNMPEPEPDGLQYESAYRPAPVLVQTGYNQIKQVNWRRIMSAEQWACVRFTVRLNDYYISRGSLADCRLSNEQYRDLRAELIRCHVLPSTGNGIVDSDAARAVFSPAPSGDE